MARTNYSIKPSWALGIIFLVVSPLIAGYVMLTILPDMPILLYYILGAVVMLAIDFAITKTLFKELGKKIGLAVSILLPFLQIGLLGFIQTGL